MRNNLKYQVRQIFREYMFKKEMNQSQLADKLDVNKSVVSQLIHENYNISLDKLEEYCNKLGITLEIRVK